MLRYELAKAKDETINQKDYKMSTLSFNSGRTYTEYGQRIAAHKLKSGEIIMLDIDRGIDYLFPSTIEFTKRDIMQAYDNNNNIYPYEIDLDIGTYYSLLSQLREIANNVSSI